MDALGAELAVDNSFKMADRPGPKLRNGGETGEAGGGGELSGGLIEAVVGIEDDIVIVGEIVEVIEQRTPEPVNPRGWHGGVSTCGVQHVGQTVDSKANGHIVPAEVFNIGVGLGGGVRVVGDPIAGQGKCEREIARL